MQAKMVLPSGIFFLDKISREDMDGILNDATQGWLRGYPVYFDETKRLWPRPDGNTPKVEFDG